MSNQLILLVIYLTWFSLVIFIEYKLAKKNKL